jgi:hypothetical protein
MRRRQVVAVAHIRIPLTINFPDRLSQHQAYGDGRSQG